MTIQQAIESAVALQNAGQLQQAEQLYRRVLGVDPNHPDALHLLGKIAIQVGAFEPARELIGRAIAAAPQVADYHASFADASGALGDAEAAMSGYQKALELRPDFVEARNNLGIVLAERGQTDQAIEHYRQAIALHPDLAHPWCNLSQALLQKGEKQASLEAAEKSISLDPNLADAHNNRGAAKLRLGRIEEAAQSFHHAIDLRAEFPLAHANLAMTQLLKGDFENGWAEYEWRLRLTDSIKFRPDFPVPRWQGEDLDGKRILLHAEQGFGDVIHFARYVPMVAELGAIVYIGCHPQLKRLMNTLSGVVDCVTRDEPAPEIDFHCPLPSLGFMFKTNSETIPKDVPYLWPDPQWIDRFRDRVPGGTGLKRIGLAWKGRPTHADDRSRSMSVDQFVPIARVKNVWLTSLQKGEASKPSFEMTDFTAELNDFADTSGLIKNLDLVICVDTAVAHLAGAMGKPVWVLLPFAPDWRWMLDRTNSQWYPTMRLFRQPQAGDWQTPIQQIVERLEAGEF